MKIRKLSSFKALFVVFAIFAFSFPAFIYAEGTESTKIVRIGYTQGIDPLVEQESIIPTINYLKKHNPEYIFELIQVSSVDTIDDIKRSNLNFLFVPSNFYIEINEKIPLTHIVTRRTLKGDNPSKTVGSVFIVREDRKDLNSISDLKGKTCVASLPNSLGGWLAALGEIKKQGYNPDKFFEKISFLQFQMPDVLNAVLSGAADVGVLSSCMLENSIEEGLIEGKSLKVINPQKDKENLRCVRSTQELYPDIVFLAVKGTPESIVRNIAISLLSMSGVLGYQWSFDDDYFSVRELLQSLQIGPYAYLRDTSPLGLFNRFKEEIFIGALLLLFLVANEFRLNWLVKRRTKQLDLALKEKVESDRIVREERRKFSILEKNGLISQMSSIIAHEAKQPMGTILNYLEILRMQLAEEKSVGQQPLLSIDHIEQQVLRLNALIESVRNFAKKKQNPLVKSDLVQIAQKAVRTFKRNEVDFDKVDIRFNPRIDHAFIKSDPFSLELLILNLLRNGAHAAIHSVHNKKPTIYLTIDEEENRFVLLVENTGDEMTKEQMDRLITLGESVKTEGLGLGLSIIRSIADQHSADLSFIKRSEGGVIARLQIDRLKNSHDDK